MPLPQLNLRAQEPQTPQLLAKTGHPYLAALLSAFWILALIATPALWLATVVCLRSGSTHVVEPTELHHGDKPKPSKTVRGEPNVSSDGAAAADQYVG